MSALGGPALLAPANSLVARARRGRTHVHLTASPDAIAVRVVARARVALTIGVAAVGSFLPGLTPHGRALFLLLGLVWVPWACVVLFSADTAGHRLAVVGGPSGDLLALFTIAALAPSGREGVLLGTLVVLAFADYTTSRQIAALLTSGAIGLTLAAQAIGPSAHRLSNGQILPFSAAAVALLTLIRRTTAEQARVSARAAGLQSKADVILAHVAGGIYVTDDRGRILQCNEAAGRVIGSDAPVGRACGSALALHLGERALDCSAGCALLALGDADAGDQGHEVWRADASGRRQPLLASAAEVRTSDGVEVVHSLRDITRLKQVEEAKTLFLATASHELKTPLTVINGFAETLTQYRDLDADTSAAALEAIRTRAQELTRIVDRLLLSSRIEAGRVSLRSEPVQVGPLVLERASALGAATGRVVRSTVDEDLPTVTANQEALITVVDHLIENALKYSPGGEPVDVEACVDGNGVRVAVTDEGIGMDPEQAARCFERFWQAESTDVRRFGGTGIGLYIVHSLVEAMGGRVDVRSELGAGSTFTVRISVRAGLPEQRDPGMGEATSIREFMRQIGVPERRRR